jgi:hypothetical protein
MAFFTALLALLAFLILPTAPASAAKVEPWSYNGNITWKHPDGRKIRSRRIMTKFDNDSLSIFRSRDGRYHARFIYRDTAKLLDSRSRFFILDRRDHKTARRVYLEIDARAWPSKTGGGGYVVGQLTKGDFKTLRKYAGNLLGASYYSRKRGEANGRLRHYSFTGKGFLAALKRLTGVSSPALGESLSTAPGGSSGSSTSGSSSSSAATFVGFSPKWTSCSRPSLSNINSERRVDRLIRRTKSWLRCRERNEDTARRQMIEHYGKAGIKITYGKQSDGTTNTAGAPINSRTRSSALQLRKSTLTLTGRPVLRTGPGAQSNVGTGARAATTRDGATHRLPTPRQQHTGRRQPTGRPSSSSAAFSKHHRAQLTHRR